MSGEDDEPVEVGIGIIRRGRRFLIRQRPPGTVYAGYWEFPGGKCERGELPAQATIRECLEEVGLPVVIKQLRRVLVHRYPHGLVRLSFYDCSLLNLAHEPAETTGFTWVDAEQLPSLRFPEANDVIVSELIGEARRGVINSDCQSS